MKTKFWFDSEFMEDGRTIELLSIGIVCEDGREFYAENAEANWDHANEWVVKNVLPQLRGVPISGGPDFSHPTVMTRDQMANQILYFVNDEGSGGEPEFWAYYGAYDWIVLCQLFGRMIDLPEGWPMFAMDVKQLCVELGDPKLPPQVAKEHWALADARWTRDAWSYLEGLKVHRS